MLDFIIRSEKVSDISHVYELVCDAFDQPDESKLVNALRDCGALTFSLVAEDKNTGELLGHIAFSSVTIVQQVEKGVKNWQALALAPIAVKKKYQNLGVGGALINFWFSEYADDFYNAVVLLGRPTYYPRFGFKKSSDFEIYWEKDCPEGFFQIKEIKEGFLNKVSGTVYYHDQFSKI